MLKRTLLGLGHSFRHAFQGMIHVWSTQRNMRLHFSAGYLVLVLSAWLEFDALQTLILFLTVGAVIVAELFNTALEAAVDVATQEYHPQARIAKDVAAAAVLATSLLSLVVAVYLFGPALGRLPAAVALRWQYSPGSVVLHTGVFFLLLLSSTFVRA